MLAWAYVMGGGSSTGRAAFRADTAAYAADLAKKGAARLEGAELPNGMFGDFDAAHSFHGTVTSAHGRHVDQLHNHHATLTDTSNKVHSVAQAFKAADGDDDGMNPQPARIDL